MGLMKTDDTVIRRGMAPVGSYVGVFGSQVGGIIWEGLDGLSLLGNVCYWGKTLKFKKRLVPFPVSLFLPHGCASG